MIWVAGEIVPDDALKISVLDRTFEHGLGLFETFRTWNGHATLLDHHVARMTRSALEFGLPIERAALPGVADVGAFLKVIGHSGDAVLRITMSGGLSEREGPIVWMRASPLPTSTRDGGVTLAFGTWQVDFNESLAKCKSLNYWSKRIRYELAQKNDANEILSTTADGRVWEGSRTNVFLVRNGILATPHCSGPLLPGVMRSLILERAPRLGLKVEERDISIAEIVNADEVFLTNSVRGIIPVGQIRSIHRSAPGPVTKRLWDDILPWLNRGGIDP